MDWHWWIVIAAVFFMGMIGAVGAIIAFNKGRGKLGGALPLFDMRSYERGGRVNVLGIYGRNGNYATLQEGGNVGLLVQNGLFGMREESFPSEEVFIDHRAGFAFLGWEGAKKFFKMAIENDRRAAEAAINKMQQAVDDLSIAIHDPNVKLDELIAKVEKLAKAQPVHINKTGGQRR